MVTCRNRRTPSGNCALISGNTEVVQGWKPGIGDDSERLDTLGSSGQSKRLATIAAAVRATCYRMVFRRSSGPLLGVTASKPKRGCLSANKGTREARSRRVITQPAQRLLRQASPKRRTSGGAVVVVRGWESQPHGEGRQELSFWTAEGFTNREGSR
jgi:hypothetical protein